LSQTLGVSVGVSVTFFTFGCVTLFTRLTGGVVTFLTDIVDSLILLGADLAVLVAEERLRVAISFQ
tara:strand:- start:102 stop:299 length:198 start_codon:yes stop_codon:yes gene_type:complete